MPSSSLWVLLMLLLSVHGKVFGGYLMRLAYEVMFLLVFHSKSADDVVFSCTAGIYKCEHVHAGTCSVSVL
jgi:hypothetical protein